jgi:hypothetical protein
LSEAKHSEQLYRELAERHPDSYTADWTTTLTNLAEALALSEQFTKSLECAEVSLKHISALSQRYPRVYRPWLGFAHRVAAEALTGLQRGEEADAEANRSVEVWVEVAQDRQNFESEQVAKAFRTKVRCKVALNKPDQAVEALEQAFRVLRRPLEANVKSLRPIMLDLIGLSEGLAGQAATAAIPQGALSILRSND